MTEATIVAVFASQAHAEAAQRDLLAAGVPQAAVVRHASIHTVPGYSVSDEPAARPSGFWSRLFGGEHDRGDLLADRGQDGAILVIETSDSRAADIIGIIERHELVDLDEHVATERT